MLLSTLSAGAQTLIIPQIADGGGWQTTIVLTNTTTSIAVANLSFFQEGNGGSTSAWSLPLLETVTPSNISLRGGSTLYLHTSASAPVTSVGWAQLQASTGVVGYAIFTLRVPGRQDQDGTAPAAVSAARYLVPFDDSSNFVMGVAIVNPAPVAEAITVSVQADNGQVIQLPPIALPAFGHISFQMPLQFAATGGIRGLAEFYCATGNINVLALRFNPTGAFTAAPVYPQTGTPVIGNTPGAPSAPFANLVGTVTFQPFGSPSGQVIFTVTPNAGNLSFSASVSGGATFINGNAGNNNQTFSFVGMQPGGLFVAPGLSTPLTVTGGYLNFTITPTTSGIVGNEGSLAGTMSVTGTPGNGAAPITLTGAISGTYLITPVAH